MRSIEGFAPSEQQPLGASHKGIGSGRPQERLLVHLCACASSAPFCLHDKICIIVSSDGEHEITWEETLEGGDGSRRKYLPKILSRCSS